MEEGRRSSKSTPHYENTNTDPTSSPNICPRLPPHTPDSLVDLQRVVREWSGSTTAAITPAPASAALFPLSPLIPRAPLRTPQLSPQLPSVLQPTSPVHRHTWRSGRRGSQTTLGNSSSLAGYGNTDGKGNEGSVICAAYRFSATHMTDEGSQRWGGDGNNFSVHSHCCSNDKNENNHTKLPLHSHHANEGTWRSGRLSMSTTGATTVAGQRRLGCVSHRGDTDEAYASEPIFCSHASPAGALFTPPTAPLVERTLTTHAVVSETLHGTSEGQPESGNHSPKPLFAREVAHLSEVKTRRQPAASGTADSGDSEACGLPSRRGQLAEGEHPLFVCSFEGTLAQAGCVRGGNGTPHAGCSATAIANRSLGTPPLPEWVVTSFDDPSYSQRQQHNRRDHHPSQQQQRERKRPRQLAHSAFEFVQGDHPVRILTEEPRVTTDEGTTMRNHYLSLTYVPGSATKQRLLLRQRRIAAAMHFVLVACALTAVILVRLELDGWETWLGVMGDSSDLYRITRTAYWLSGLSLVMVVYFVTVFMWLTRAVHSPRFWNLFCLGCRGINGEHDDDRVLMSTTLTPVHHRSYQKRVEDEVTPWLTTSRDSNETTGRSAIQTRPADDEGRKRSFLAPVSTPRTPTDTTGAHALNQPADNEYSIDKNSESHPRHRNNRSDSETIPNAPWVEANGVSGDHADSPNAHAHPVEPLVADHLAYNSHCNTGEDHNYHGNESSSKSNSSCNSTAIGRSHRSVRVQASSPSQSDISGAVYAVEQCAYYSASAASYSVSSNVFGGSHTSGNSLSHHNNHWSGAAAAAVTTTATAAAATRVTDTSPASIPHWPRGTLTSEDAPMSLPPSPHTSTRCGRSRTDTHATSLSIYSAGLREHTSSDSGATFSIRVHASANVDDNGNEASSDPSLVMNGNARTPRPASPAMHSTLELDQTAAMAATGLLSHVPSAQFTTTPIRVIPSTHMSEVPRAPQSGRSFSSHRSARRAAQVTAPRMPWYHSPALLMSTMLRWLHGLYFAFAMGVLVAMLTLSFGATVNLSLSYSDEFVWVVNIVTDPNWACKHLQIKGKCSGWSETCGWPDLHPEEATFLGCPYCPSLQPEVATAGADMTCFDRFVRVRHRSRVFFQAIMAVEGVAVVVTATWMGVAVCTGAWG